jgi:GntR family transcriptional regulator, carbon starvation induced regulator
MEAKSERSSESSLTLKAYQLLRDDIISARLLPLARLRIQALTERYGIGATAIREALSRLVTDDLVSFVDQRGFCVAPMSRSLLADLAQTRLDLDRLAIRYAVERGGVEWEANLLTSFHLLSRAPAPNSPENALAWSKAHRHFHLAIVAGSGSDWLMRLCALLYDQSERYRNFAIAQAESSKRDTASEHKVLLEAALERDGEKLDHLISEHFARTTKIIQQADFDSTSSFLRGQGRVAENDQKG